MCGKWPTYKEVPETGEYSSLMYFLDICLLKLGKMERKGPPPIMRLPTLTRTPPPIPPQCLKGKEPYCQSYVIITWTEDPDSMSLSGGINH